MMFVTRILFKKSITRIWNLKIVFKKTKSGLLIFFWIELGEIVEAGSGCEADGETKVSVEVHLDGEKHRFSTRPSDSRIREYSSKSLLFLAKERCLGRAKVMLESKPWISQKQVIILLNQATDIINLWQQSGGDIQ